MSKEHASKPSKRPESLAEPYDWGNSWFKRSPLIKFDQQEKDKESEISTLQGYHRVSHPNISVDMKTTGGQLSIDPHGKVPVSTNQMLEYYRESRPFGDGEGDPGQGWGGLHQDDVEAASDKLRRDAEEIAVAVGPVVLDESDEAYVDTTVGKLAELDKAIVADPPEPTGRFKKWKAMTPQTLEWRRENMRRDKEYIAERVLWLVGLGGGSDPVKDFDPIHVVGKHNAMQNTFLNARRRDDRTNKDVLQEIAWDQAHNDYDEYGNPLHTDKKDDAE